MVIDPSYKQLKEAKAVTLSFNNEQAGGITYTSALLGDMAFAEDMPGFVLVLDRAHRVRGYGRGFIMDGQRQDTVEREANRLVEDLLLNIDKSEKITYAEDEVQQQGIVSLGKKTVVGTDDPANFDFQTDLKKAMIEESRKKSGTSVAESPFFKYLGKPIPNYSVKSPDGSAVKLHDLLGPRVDHARGVHQPGEPGDEEPVQRRGHDPADRAEHLGQFRSGRGRARGDERSQRLPRRGVARLLLPSPGGGAAACLPCPRPDTLFVAGFAAPAIPYRLDSGQRGIQDRVVQFLIQNR